MSRKRIGHEGQVRQEELGLRVSLQFGDEMPPDDHSKSSFGGQRTETRPP